MLKESLLVSKHYQMEEKETSSVTKKSLLKQFQFFWRKHIYLPIILGPLIGFFTILIAMLCGMEHPMAKTLGLAAGMMTWWLEGSIRMGITGLVPIIFLPLMGVASGTSVAQSYFSDSVVVCMGSLIMASAVEKYQLHHRAAKYLLKYARKHGISGILFTFIGITGFLSMWLSNTATAALMIPLSNAVFDYMKDHPELHQGITALDAGTAIDLGIAFAASLGGMSTITGTGSNLVLQGTMSSLFGSDGEVTFVSWFIIAAPLSVINLFLLWVLLGCCFLWKSYVYIPHSTSMTVAWRKVWKRNDSDAEFSRYNDESTSQDEHSSQASSSNSKTIQSISNPLGHPPHTTSGLSDSGSGGISIPGYTGITAGSTKRVSSHASSISYLSLKEECMDQSGTDQLRTPSQSTMSASGSSVTTTTPSHTGTNFDDFPPMTYPEYVVVLTFTAMALLWMTRDPPEDWGWKTLLVNGDDPTDGTVAIAAAVFLLVAPNRPPRWCSGWCGGGTSPDNNEYDYEAVMNETIHPPPQSSSSSSSIPLVVENIGMRHDEEVGKDVHHTTDEEEEGNEETQQRIHETGIHSTQHPQPQQQQQQFQTYEPILTWSAVQDLNWDIVFLLGGGFALSLGFQQSGLSEWLADLLIDNGPQEITGFSILASIIACVCTNVMSNVAAANVLIASLACVGPIYGEAPLAVLTPVALSISLAFLFPIGTPPNAIALANKRLTITTMFRVGCLATLLFLTSTLTYCIYVLPFLTDLHHVPQSILQTCGVDDMTFHGH